MAEVRTINVHRVNVSSVAKIFGVAWGLLQLVVGFIGSFTATAYILGLNNVSAFGKVWYSLLAVVIALVVYPLISFAFGWLYGALVALIVNLVMHYSNGLELDVEDEGVALKSAK